MKLSNSQNFLKDPKLIKHLINLTSINKDSTVVEIGAGNGIITAELCKYAKYMIAYELDSLLCKRLNNRTIRYSNLKIFDTDFLKVKLPSANYYIFSNIPFNLSRKIFDKILESKNPPQKAWLIVQKEFAEKYLGKPTNNLTSFMFKPFYKFKILYYFRKEDFEPRPRVNAVLLEIEKQEQPLLSSKYKQEYYDFLAYVLTSWSKDIKHALSKIFTYNQLKRLSKDNKFSLNANPTSLSVDQMIAIFLYFRTLDKSKRNIVKNEFMKLKKQQSKLSKIYRSRVVRGWNKS